MPLPVQSAAGASEQPQPGQTLSEWERVGDTYVAPSKTFENIRRKSTWWLPFLLLAVISIAFAYAVDQEVGFEKVAETSVSQSSQAQERLASLPDAQRARTIQTIAATTRVFTYLSPVFSLLVALGAAAILMMSFNFGLGSEARFAQYLAVYMYASLPMAIKYVLAIITLFAGVSTDQFDLRNPVGTNIGFYLSSDLPLWLRTLFSSVDIFTIWTVVLLVVGCSIVARVKRGSAAAIVVGWWLLMILGFTVSAAVQG